MLNINSGFFLNITEATADELRLQREEKKRYLLRKLSFRPSVDELKSRKVIIYGYFFAYESWASIIKEWHKNSVFFQGFPKIF